ncbi:MAG TPA: hypothetical protein ENG33_04140, partial [Chloroflexi bacterium]|nr:hypothetical protein [Chloroflexota bacterium]
MAYALLWWFVISILGLTALPLVRRLFSALPDEGYAFAKPLGLLLASYVLWLGCSLGFLFNSPGGALFSLMAVAAISWTTGERDVRGFIRKHSREVIFTEALFAFAFFAFACFRAYSPEILGTEKPMEFAFLNAILRSQRFPPYDPWLSGFAISYYYFGYVMIAFLTRLTGTPSSIAFNLGIALLFALTAMGA